MQNTPPITIYLDASADIEAAAHGLAVVTALVHVELSDALLERLAIRRDVLA